jgi:hypothetical protein
MVYFLFELVVLAMVVLAMAIDNSLSAGQTSRM